MAPTKRRELALSPWMVKPGDLICGGHFPVIFIEKGFGRCTGAPGYSLIHRNEQGRMCEIFISTVSKVTVLR